MNRIGKRTYLKDRGQNFGRDGSKKPVLHLRGVFLANGFNFWEKALKYPLSLVFVQLVSVSAVIVCVLCLTKRELES